MYSLANLLFGEGIIWRMHYLANLLFQKNHHFIAITHDDYKSGIRIKITFRNQSYD